jgi:hypothetical protein
MGRLSWREDGSIFSTRPITGVFFAQPTLQSSSFDPLLYFSLLDLLDSPLLDHQLESTRSSTEVFFTWPPKVFYDGPSIRVYLVRPSTAVFFTWPSGISFALPSAGVFFTWPSGVFFARLSTIWIKNWNRRRRRCSILWHLCGTWTVKVSNPI